MAGVEQAEAIETRLDLEVRADLAVDENAVCTELGNPGAFGVAGDIVEDLTVGAEVAIAEDQRHLVFAAGEVKGIFGLVADQKHAEEAGVGVEAGEAHGVVVIPECRGVLLKRVGADAGLAGDEPVFGVAIVLWRRSWLRGGGWWCGRQGRQRRSRAASGRWAGSAWWGGC